MCSLPQCLLYLKETPDTVSEIVCCHCRVKRLDFVLYEPGLLFSHAAVHLLNTQLARALDDAMKY